MTLARAHVRRRFTGHAKARYHRPGVDRARQSEQGGWKVKVQKTAVIAACWLTFLSPLAAHAVDVDYPDLGVKLTNLPQSAKAGRVGESLQGYSARILFGDEATSAEIYRFDEAVPEGSITDKSYREALNKQLGVPETEAPINKPVTLAGQLAWMTGFAQGFGPMAVYRCSFYLVVGQHLYQLAVSATGKKQAAASSFNAAAQAIASGLVFEPVERQPDKPLAPGELPPFLMGRQLGPFYPERARRLGEAGIVMLKFNIDGRGSHSRPHGGARCECRPGAGRGVDAAEWPVQGVSRMGAERGIKAIVHHGVSLLPALSP